ncbi:unnamed protein product [Effrenium voratum]|nr:unnamed protein product [Effrenium voratum]
MPNLDDPCWCKALSHGPVQDLSVAAKDVRIVEPALPLEGFVAFPKPGVAKLRPRRPLRPKRKRQLRKRRERRTSSATSSATMRGLHGSQPCENRDDEQLHKENSAASADWVPSEKWKPPAWSWTRSPRRSSSQRCRSPKAGLPASESAVVFGAIATSVPAELWRQRSVVELGCGSGYVGLVLSCLGARVTLTDLPEYEDKILSSIAANVAEIKPPGNASFCCLDWAAPRANPRAAYALRCASVVLAIDPVVCQHSQQSFLTLLKAIFGLEGPPLCPDLQGCIVAHKHQQNFCVGGYSAPSKDAAPSITHSDSCDRCTFRRALEDAGVTVRTFEIPPPREFVHPFIEYFHADESDKSLSHGWSRCTMPSVRGCQASEGVRSEMPAVQARSREVRGHGAATASLWLQAQGRPAARKDGQGGHRPGHHLIGLGRGRGDCSLYRAPATAEAYKLNTAPIA